MIPVSGNNCYFAVSNLSGSTLPFCSSSPEAKSVLCPAVISKRSKHLRRAIASFILDIAFLPANTEMCLVTAGNNQEFKIHQN